MCRASCRDSVFEQKSNWQLKFPSWRSRQPPYSGVRQRAHFILYRSCSFPLGNPFVATAGEHPQLGPLCNRHLACQCACVFLSLTTSYMRASAGSFSGSSQDTWAMKKTFFGGKVCILQMNETMSEQIFTIFPWFDPFYLDPSPCLKLM